MNRFQFTGNLGRDAEVKNLQSGQTVLSFAVAITEKWKDKTGNPQEKTTWVNCTQWLRDGKSGIAPYLTKGTKVLVEGKPSARGYVNKEGDAVANLECDVQGIELIGSRGEAQQPQAQPASSLPAMSDIDDGMPF
jgi:single-strand DNA-binding protein